MNKTYKIFKHDSGKIKAIKQGWSWPALIFTVFYSLYARLWGFFLFMLAASLQFISTVTGFFLAAKQNSQINNMTFEYEISWYFVCFYILVYIVIAIIFALLANNLRSKKLLKANYQQVAVLVANNSTNAINKYISNS